MFFSCGSAQFVCCFQERKLGFASLSAAPDDFRGGDVTLDKNTGGNEWRRAADLFTQLFFKERAENTARHETNAVKRVYCEAQMGEKKKKSCLERRREVVAFGSGVNWCVTTETVSDGRLERRTRPTARCPGVNVACLAEPSQTGQAALPESGRWLGPKTPPKNTHISGPRLCNLPGTACQRSLSAINTSSLLL